MARPIVVMAFLTVGFGKFILFVKKSATNPTDKVKATFRILGIPEMLRTRLLVPGGTVADIIVFRYYNLLILDFLMPVSA